MAITDKKPAGLMRAMFRAPIWFYRWNIGWLMGGRFLLLSHTGRKSGLARQTVLEVVSHNAASGVYFIAAAWRERSDWFRNIQQNPNVGVQVRNHKFEARAKQVSTWEGGALLWDYAQKHPGAFKELAVAMFGERMSPDEETCQKMAGVIPIIALNPTG